MTHAWRALHKRQSQRLVASRDNWQLQVCWQPIDSSIRHPTYVSELESETLILPQTLGINVFTSGKSDFTRFSDSFFAFFNVFPNKKSTFQRNVWSLSNLDTYGFWGVSFSSISFTIETFRLQQFEVSKFAFWVANNVFLKKNVTFWVENHQFLGKSR